MYSCSYRPFVFHSRYYRAHWRITILFDLTLDIAFCFLRRHLALTTTSFKDSICLPIEVDSMVDSLYEPEQRIFSLTAGFLEESEGYKPSICFI
jgi:hypothetical protein